MSGLGDWRGVPPPQKRTLQGAYVRLEGYDEAAHGAALYQALGGDAHINDFTKWMAMGPYRDAADFAATLTRREREEGFVSYAVFPESSAQPQGKIAFLRIRPHHGSLELGAVAFGPKMARSRAATQAVYLMMSYAFDVLGYRRLEWKCHAQNEASNRAAKRFGFRFEGIFRNHMVVKGRSRDSAWYAIIDEDWPNIKSAYERWLAPDNFDAEGKQLTPLKIETA